MKTNELTGAALDWAAAKCEGTLDHYVQPNEKRGTSKWEITPSTRRYSTNWAQGGPIIEREGIATRENGDSDDWYACKRWDNHGKFGATPLIAAMRCYVASKLGDDVEIPEELL
jgi:hypothetical protein